MLIILEHFCTCVVIKSSFSEQVVIRHERLIICDWRVKIGNLV